MTEIPRRNRIDKFTPAERAIYDAVQTVEAMAADVRLTDAVILLQAARDSVADYIDNIWPSRRYVSALPASAFPHAKGEDWQPIETAPKDQTVLLYGAYTSGSLGLVQGAWNHGGAMHMPHWMGGIIRPTHWQPLPLPPSARPASLEAEKDRQ